MAKLFANSGNPDLKQHDVASDLGLHCLPDSLLGVSRLQWVIRLYSFKWFAKSKGPYQTVCLCVRMSWVFSVHICLKPQVHFDITKKLPCQVWQKFFRACWVKNSADDILKYIFYIFSNRLDLTFHANYLLSCMKCQILFFQKNKKKKGHQFVICWIFPESGKCLNQYFYIIWDQIRRMCENITWFSTIFH